MSSEHDADIDSELQAAFDFANDERHEKRRPTSRKAKPAFRVEQVVGGGAPGMGRRS